MSEYGHWETVDFKPMPGVLSLVYIQDWEGKQTTFIDPCHGVLIVREPPERGEEYRLTGWSTAAVPAAWDSSTGAFEPAADNCFAVMPEADARKYDGATWELVDFNVDAQKNMKGEMVAFVSGIIVRFTNGDDTWIWTDFDGDKLSHNRQIEDAKAEAVAEAIAKEAALK